MKHSSKHDRFFLLPWAVGFILLTFLPMLASVGLSLTRVAPPGSASSFSWVGFDHYRTALGIDRTVKPARGDPWIWRALGGKPTDPHVYTAIYNSLFYSLLAVPLGLAFSLAVAWLLHQPVRGVAIFRAMVYLPHLLGGVATIVIWSWLFNPQFGWINAVIRFVYGVLDPVVRLFNDQGTGDWIVPRWLYSPAGCKPAVIIMSVWTMGGSMLIFLAALKRVSPFLLDAARIDGAGAWGRFRCITLPQISPAILFNLIVGLVFSMQSFSEAYLLQNRQQDDGLLFLVLYLYDVAFQAPYRLGYASALGWILMGLLLVLIGPLLWSARRWVHYAGDT